MDAEFPVGIGGHAGKEGGGFLADLLFFAQAGQGLHLGGEAFLGGLGDGGDAGGVLVGIEFLEDGEELGSGEGGDGQGTGEAGSSAQAHDEAGDVIENAAHAILGIVGEVRELKQALAAAASGLLELPHAAGDLAGGAVHAVERHVDEGQGLLAQVIGGFAGTLEFAGELLGIGLEDDGDFFAGHGVGSPDGGGVSNQRGARSWRRRSRTPRSQRETGPPWPGQRQRSPSRRRAAW